MENFDTKRLLKTFLNIKFYIILILLFCLCIGYFYSYHYKVPMYSSSAVILLAQNNDDTISQDNGSYITQKDITLNKNLLSTYTQLAKSNKVLDQVIQNLNLNISSNQLAKLVTVKSANNTEVIKVSVNNENAKLAAGITNELLNVFSKEITSLYNMNNVHIMDKAQVNTIPHNINHNKDLIMFFGIGMMLSFSLLILIYIFDNTIKSEKDIEDFANLSVLSSIPIYTNKTEKGNELIVDSDPKSPISEAFKACRTNIMFSGDSKKSNAILVTSASPSDGKSFVSSNLALAFAKTGKKVLLIDTDMRNGRSHNVFNVKKHLGLSNCLSNIQSNKSCNINKYIQETKYNNLHIMTSGDIAPNPSELLSASCINDFFYTLKTKYDVIICDGTPSILVSDSIILSKVVDSTIIVASYKTTKLDTILKVKKSIEIVGGHITGTILNKLELTSKAYKNKYYDKDCSDNQNIAKSDILNHDMLLNSPLYLIEKSDVLEELNEIKVNDSIIQKENISSENLEIYNVISDKLDCLAKNIELPKNIVTKLDYLKQNKDKSIESLQSQISSLNTDISNLVNSQSNYDLSKEFETIYNSNTLQVEAIEKLEQKMENIDNSSYIDDKLNELSILISNKFNNLDNNTISTHIIDKLDALKTNKDTSIEDLKNQINDLNKDISILLKNQTNEDLSLDMQNLYSSNLKQTQAIEKLEENVKNIDNTSYIDTKINELSTLITDRFDNLKNDKSTYSENLQNQIDNISNDISSLIESQVNDKLFLDIQDLYTSNSKQTEIIKELEKQLKTINNSSYIDNKINELYNFFTDKLDNIVDNKIPLEIIDKLEELKNSKDTSIEELQNNIYNINVAINTLVENQSNNELSLDIQNLYSSNLKQTESITNLEEKIETINQTSYIDNKVNEISSKLHPILEDTSSLKNALANSIQNQEVQIEQIHKLEDVIETIKITYQSRFSKQEEYLASLENKLNELMKSNSNNIHEEVKPLYHKENSSNSKIIKLQDYITYSQDIPHIKHNKHNKAIEGQLDLLLNNTLKNIDEKHINSSKNKFTIDYDKVNKKRNKKGFFTFLNNNKYIENIQEEVILEEEAPIVSQILSIG